MHAITDSEGSEILSNILKEHSSTCAAHHIKVSNGRVFDPVLDNWRRGYDWSLSFAAMQRHAWQFWNGEDVDEESGSKHLIAAAWHCLTIAHWMEDDDLRGYFDDRPRK